MTNGSEQFPTEVVKDITPGGFSRSTEVTGPIIDGDTGEETASGDICCMSPHLYAVEYRAKPEFRVVSLDPDPQIENSDVKQISITMHTEGLSGTVVLNNRQSSDKRNQGGRYLYDLRDLKSDGPGGAADIENAFNAKSNFTGVKPIRIDYGISAFPAKNLKGAIAVADGGDLGAHTGGYQESPVQRRFTGFVTERNYRRPGTGQSEVILTLEDVSLRAKDIFVINVPLFDGWCHLAVMYYLLVIEAGYPTEEVLYFQDPNDPQTTIQLRDVMKFDGSVEDMKGGCWDGHFKGYKGLPVGASGQAPELFHWTLPLSHTIADSNYMFQMGTSVWDCCREIAGQTQWALYANAHGNIIYQPLPVALGLTGPGATEGGASKKKFREVPGEVAIEPGVYNELQRTLDVTSITKDVRNEMMLWGLVQSGTYRYDGIVEVRRDPRWPFNVSAPWYVPWFRTAIRRNPLYNDGKRLKQMSDEYYKRLIRPRYTVRYGAWGQSKLFPYNIVTIDESEANETGITDQKLIIYSITDTVDATTKQYISELEVEVFQPQFYSFDPEL